MRRIDDPAGLGRRVRQIREEEGLGPGDPPLRKVLAERYAKEMKKALDEANAQRHEMEEEHSKKLAQMALAHEQALEKAVVEAANRAPRTGDNSIISRDEHERSLKQAANRHEQAHAASLAAAPLRVPSGQALDGFHSASPAACSS